LPLLPSQIEEELTHDRKLAAEKETPPTFAVAEKAFFLQNYFAMLLILSKFAIQI